MPGINLKCGNGNSVYLQLPDLSLPPFLLIEAHKVQMEENPHPRASSIAVTMTSEDAAQQKRKFSDLPVEEEKLQVLESGHAVKRYGPRHYI